MLRVLGLVIGLTQAVHAEPALVLIAKDAGGEPLAAELRARGLEPASPIGPPEPAVEAALARVRPLYQQMAFAQAISALEEAEEALIAERLPTLGWSRALAEIELWRGACLWLAQDRAGALERWQLAVRLQPGARPDRIFPPEVQTAFRTRAPPPAPVTVTVRLAPVDARLWLDGRLASVPLAATPGLHLVVVERADFKPRAQVVRVTRSAALIASSLTDVAAPADALRQAAARLALAPLGRDEGLGVGRALGRTLWVVRADGARLVAWRFAAGDPARPIAEVAGDGQSLVTVLCAAEPSCAPPLSASRSPARPVTLSEPPPVSPAPRPIWRRAWFWGVLGVGALVVAGAATGIALGVAAPRDYEVHVR